MLWIIWVSRLYAYGPDGMGILVQSNLHTVLISAKQKLG